MSSNSNYSSWRLTPQTSMSYSQLPPIRPATNFANYRENNDNRYCNQCPEPSRRQPRNQNRKIKKNGSRKNKNRDNAYWQRVYESPGLRDDDRLLVKLKGIDDLPWKIIQAKFNSAKCKKMRQPALQMRMTRLGDKMDSIWAQQRESAFREGIRSNPNCWISETSCSRDDLMLPQAERVLSETSVPILEHSWSSSSETFAYYTPEMSTPSAGSIENVCFQSDPQRHEHYHNLTTLSHPNTWNSMYTDSVP